MKKIIGFILMILMSCCALKSQITYTFHQLSLKDGLSSQTGIYSLFKDKTGPIWIGSYYGLNSFDGKTVKPYFPSGQDSTTLIDAEIYSPIIADSSGNFWVSTINGYHYYDYVHDSFQRFQLKGRKVSGINLLGYNAFEKTLWGSNEKELLVINTQDKNNNYQIIDTLPTTFGRSKLLIHHQLDSTVSLLLPQKIGLELRTYQKNKKISNTIFDFFIQEKLTIYALFTRDKKTVWIGTNGGLFSLNLLTHKITQSVLNDKFKKKEIVGIEALDQHNLVVATKMNGLYLYNIIDQELTEPLLRSKENQIQAFKEKIEKIYLDEQKNLWIYSPGNGLLFTNLLKPKFKSYLTNDQFDTNIRPSVGGVTQDSKGQIWNLTKQGIIVLDKNGHPIPTYKHFYGPNAPFWGILPYAIFCDSKDRIWFSCSQGTYFLLPESKQFINVNTLNNYPAPIPAFVFINESQDGRIFLSSHSRGIKEIITKKEVLFFKPSIVLDNQKNVVFSHFGKNQHLLNLANKGILLFHFEHEKIVEDTIFATTAFITAAVENFAGNEYWIASSQGLFFLNKKEGIYHLQKDKHFPYQNIKGLLSDTLGNLWASSADKLIKYHTASNYHRVFTAADGLQPKEFNDWSYSKINNHLLAFGGEGGLNIFNPYTIKEGVKNANPKITEIIVNDVNTLKESVSDNQLVTNPFFQKDITLPYENNTISFRFAALEYSAPDANQFKYRITPTELEWVNSHTENFARYPNLAPGNYIFEVDATNSDGIWSGKPATINITILPPWYETWWFRSLFLLGIAGIIYLIYRNRVQQIQKEADFRRKEAEYKQLAAETETAVLRLQMNPHFIFNSMNSISSYLLQKDIETANDYLGRFARLMRKILMVAEEPYLSLYEEIELLEQYMQAEAMRFEEEFQYKFIIDKSIDTDEVLIPTMILQPFVENAIWHGISNIKGLGRIIIDFKLTNQKLICAIEDNGIGRKAASQQIATEHESKATIITKRRLKLLVVENNLDFEPSLSYQDLVDDKDLAIGTKVTLELPLI